MVIYVGEVYSDYFVGNWMLDEMLDMISVVVVDVFGVVCFW